MNLGVNTDFKINTTIEDKSRIIKEISNKEKKEKIKLLLKHLVKVSYLILFFENSYY